MKPKYFPGLDGLRGLAILSVVIYHLDISLWGFNLLQGGFLGVDIFFVLSGFLISKKVSEAIEHNKFTFKRFYINRVKRLLPAILFLSLCFLPIGWFLLLPGQLKNFAGSAVSALGIVSNVWFFKDGLYAADASQLKPFLHFWSLSIEEQFYIAFPLALFFLIQFKKKYLNLFFIGTTILSLAAALFFANKFPEAVFYLLPFRIWEFTCGTLVALSLPRRSPISDRLNSSLIRTLSLIIILGCLFFSSDTSQYIVVSNFLIVLASCCLVIQFTGNSDNWTIRLFKNKSLIFLGLISYSLYLWHNPIFAFGRVWEENPTLFSKLTWCAASLFMAMFSYYLIEKPFRYGRTFNRLSAQTLFSFVFVSTIALYFLIFLNNGYPERLGIDSKNSFRDNLVLDGTLCHKSGAPCEKHSPTGKNYILVGDSHAGAISGVFGKNLIKIGSYTQFTFTGCPHILGLTNKVVKPKVDSACQKRSKEFDSYLRDSKPATIIHLAHYNLWLEDFVDGREESGKLASLIKGKSVKDLIRQSFLKWIQYGHKVVLVLQPPEFPKNPQKIFLTQYDQSNKKSFYRTRKDVESRRKPVLNFFRSIQEPNFTTLDFVPAFCDLKYCKPFGPSGIYYTDVDHLSRAGSLKAWNALSEEIKKSITSKD